MLAAAVVGDVQACGRMTMNAGAIDGERGRHESERAA
jgi:hypothetical protein